MMFLFVLFLGLLAHSDAFPVRNSDSRFVKRIPRRHCRIRPESFKASLVSENDEEDKKNSDAELFLLEYSIDSFLRADYDRSFSEDAASPLPGLSPTDTVEAALRSLRYMDEPEPFHGAAVFLRFCVELGRGERWGTTTSSAASWVELLRGSLTPTMLARRIRGSEEFSSLLDWTQLEVSADTGNSTNDIVARVEASLSFDDETSGKISSPAELYRFELAKMLGGVWLIQSVNPPTPPLARQTPLPPRATRKRKPHGSSRRPQRQRGKPRRKQQGKRKFGSNKDEDQNENDMS